MKLSNDSQPNDTPCMLVYLLPVHSADTKGMFASLCVVEMKTCEKGPKSLGKIGFSLLFRQFRILCIHGHERVAVNYGGSCEPLLGSPHAISLLTFVQVQPVASISCAPRHASHLGEKDKFSTGGSQSSHCLLNVWIFERLGERSEPAGQGRLATVRRRISQDLLYDLLDPNCALKQKILDRARAHLA